ncbi:MAG: phosphoribosylanthranilate isomerase [Chloroflexota bacterium]|nr:phosphoribosylanthranilate isomerase [Chloroflexota bacterium]
MQPTRKPRMKICCISSKQEAQLAIHYGASALGLVSAMPSGPGVIAETMIAEIADTIPPAVATFLLTSQQDAEAIIVQQRRCHTNTIQICDSLHIDGYKKLKEALPGIALVQVVHVRGRGSIDEAAAVAPYVNGILLDSGNQSLAIKELGGTGRIHNWEISKAIREVVDVPIFLAGGLNADNVAEAIRQVQPFGVDICSGVRTNGELDETKLARYFNSIANALEG